MAYKRCFCTSSIVFRRIGTRTTKEVQKSSRTALAANQERSINRGILSSSSSRKQERSTNRIRFGSYSSSEREDHHHCRTANCSILLLLEIEIINRILDTLIPERQVVVLVRLGPEDVSPQGFKLRILLSSQIWLSSNSWICVQNIMLGKIANFWDAALGCFYYSVL